MDKEIKKHLLEVSKKAGDAIMSFYNSDYNIERKGDNTPLTEADLASNQIILKELEKYGYGFLSEEKTDNKDRLKSERVWIIDPMDGTKDFIQKTGDFSVMIGLVEKKGEVYRPIFGVVYVPVTETHYYASLGEGAFRKKKDGKEERIGVSKIDNFKESRMIGSRFHQSELEENLFNDLFLKEKIPCGSVGVKINKISEGVAEFNINPSDKTWEWDVCAADIILSEAGGILTDTKGNVFNYNREDPRNRFGYFASNGKNHNKFLKQMKSYEKD